MVGAHQGQKKHIFTHRSSKNRAGTGRNTLDVMKTGSVSKKQYFISVLLMCSSWPVHIKAKLIFTCQSSKSGACLVETGPVQPEIHWMQ